MRDKTPAKGGDPPSSCASSSALGPHSKSKVVLTLADPQDYVDRDVGQERDGSPWSHAPTQMQEIVEQRALAAIELHCQEIQGLGGGPGFSH